MTHPPTLSNIEDVVEWLESRAASSESSEVLLASEMTIHGVPVFHEDMALRVIFAHVFRLGLEVRLSHEPQGRLLRVVRDLARPGSWVALSIPHDGTKEACFAWQDHWSGASHLDSAYRFACSKHPVATTRSRLVGTYRHHAEAGEYRQAILVLHDLGIEIRARGGYWRELERAAEGLGEVDLIPLLRREFKAALRRLAASSRAE